MKKINNEAPTLNQKSHLVEVLKNNYAVNKRYNVNYDDLSGITLEKYKYILALVYSGKQSMLLDTLNNLLIKK